MSDETLYDRHRRELRNEKRRAARARVRYHASGDLEGGDCDQGGTRSYVCRGCKRVMCWCNGGHDSEDPRQQHELCDDCHEAYGRRARDVAIGIAYARIGFGPRRDDAAESVVVPSPIDGRPVLLWRGHRCVGRSAMPTPHGHQWRFGNLVKLTTYEKIQTEHDRVTREHPERGLVAWATPGMLLRPMVGWLASALRGGR